jgi:hypothetical protein
MARHPLLSLEITASNYREEMMVGMDVAVRFGPPDVESLVARKLFKTRVLTCASSAYLERRGVPRTPHDLAHHECLLFRDPQTGRPFLGSFIAANGLSRSLSPAGSSWTIHQRRLAPALPATACFRVLRSACMPFREIE